MTAIDPRFTHTIPITATRTVPFTPRSLDAAKLLREDMAPFDRAQLDLDRDRSTPVDVSDGVGASLQMLSEAEFVKRQNAIDAGRTRVRSAFETLLQQVPTPPIFQLKVPTPIERDQINTRLVQLGLQSIDQRLIRASMIEAIFEHDWGKGSVEANEAEAEELAAFMDGIWQREQAAQQAQSAWEAQEVERMLDEANGAPPRPRADLPASIILPREAARAVRLIDQIQQTPRMRAIMARQWDFERQNQMILVRMGVRSVAGLRVQPPLAIDPATDALPDEDVTALRAAMEEAYGPVLSTAAWDELCKHIDSSYTLDGFEVGNFVSPPEKPSDQTSSTGRSGDMETSGGSSTTSSTTPPPVDASEATTEKRSVSIIDVREASSPESDSLTAER